MSKENVKQFTDTFFRQVPQVGEFRLCPLNIPEDIELVHSWVTREYASYWGMQGFSVADVEAEYRDIAQNAEVYLGYCDDQPVFLMESYNPKNDPVGSHYEVQPGDRGMHILVAPAERPIAHFTWHVFTVVMDFLFTNPQIQRIVVEPDVRNEKIHVLNRRAGFEYQKVIQLADKSAHLAFCTRTQYRRALELQPMYTHSESGLPPEAASAHLQPELWARVNRLHLCKALSEFAHERLIAPQLLESDGEWGVYTVTADDADIEYRFRARRLCLNHWSIDSASIDKRVAGQSAPLDSMAFIVECQSQLGICAALLPTYLEEIASTLYGSAYKHSRSGLNVDQLLHASFQAMEQAMMEGHPAFIANNGRIGFDAADYRAFAPETGAPVKLVWLAARRERSEFAAAEDLSYDALIEQELGAETLAAFAERLREHSLAPEDYYLLPVHPWQWFNKLASLFAADIAKHHLVCLGYGEDSYQAQQSIRTFFNTRRPHKRYVKTALSVLNMGFMRGLSPYYMSTTPAINDWVAGLVTHDPYLASTGFTVLREVAAVGYHNSHLEAATDKTSPYRKMLSALWRESPVPQLQAGQRLMTMASLLFIDSEGRALLPELIKSSGSSIDQWLAAYLNSYFSPLLHCFYAHDLVFMPHGENLILVLENNLPVRAIMKDIAEEIAVMNKDVVLSEKVQRIAVDVPQELKVLSIFTDIFDGFFRYLAQILLEQADYPERRFWQQVAQCIEDYQLRHPELQEKFARHDLFAPEFTHSCLNRLQLSNNQQMIDLADPAKTLKFAGTLENPVADFRPSLTVHAEAETEAADCAAPR